jgi:hypothetical protein
MLKAPTPREPRSAMPAIRDPALFQTLFKIA